MGQSLDVRGADPGILGQPLQLMLRIEDHQEDQDARDQEDWDREQQPPDDVATHRFRPSHPAWSGWPQYRSGGVRRFPAGPHRSFSVSAVGTTYPHAPARARRRPRRASTGA